jgi:hypothetical protein
MALPIIERIEPVLGPSGGGNLVRITGEEMTPQVAVRFGAVDRRVARSLGHAGSRIVEVEAPAHDPGAVDVVLENLDGGGVGIPGERATAFAAYEYARSTGTDLERLVRTLVRALKREVLANVHVAVHVDYADAEGEDVRLTPLASVPSLVLSGPTVRPARAYRSAVAADVVVGSEVWRHRPRLTMDLAFGIIGASSSTVELLGLLSAVAHFLSRNPWIAMLRDPDRPNLGVARWDLDLDGDWRTQIPGPDGIHVFTTRFLVRGFDLDEGLLRERLQRVDTVVLETGAPSAGGDPS